MALMWRVPLSRAQLNDVAITLLFLTLGVCIYLAGFATVNDAPSIAVPDWFSLIMLGIAGGFQLLRSTHPALALAGVSAVLTVDSICKPSILVWLVFSDVVYAACVYGGPRLVRACYAICAVVSLATLTAVAVYPPTADWRVLFICALWLLAVVGSPLAYGLAVREHRSALALERQHSLVLADLAAHERADAIAAERAHLARELHDVIAGRLSAIAMNSAAALQYPDDDEMARRALGAVRTSSVEALTEMRGLIDLLSTPGADSASAARQTAGLRRIDRLIGPIVESGTSVDLDCPPWLYDLATTTMVPAVVDIAAYRILAESLTNATTHAPGEPISITIRHTGRELTLRVNNTQQGGTTRSAAGHTGRGIANMHTRAEAVGGTVRITVTRHTFSVSAQLPTHEGPTGALTRPHVEQYRAESSA